VLNGDGGDEIFAGYRRYMATQYSWLLKMIPAWSPDLLMRIGGGSLPPRSKLGLLTRFARAGSLTGIGERYLAWTSNMFREPDKAISWQRDVMRPTEQLMESLAPQGLSNLDTQLQLDIRVNLLSDLLVKMDMATMAGSIESRSPLLDQDVADLAMRLPDDFRIRRGTLKSVLREAYRGRVPEEVLSGPKRGFEVPLNEWLQRDFKPLLNDTLASNNSHVRGFVDGAYLTDILSGKRLGDRNWSSIVYSLLVLELWLREWNTGTLGVCRAKLDCGV